MKPAWLIAIAALAATPAVAQQAPQYIYTARTEAPAARQGAVRAGVLTWQCQGSVCTITGPWPFPIPAGCAQLAREVGRIVSFGREGRMLGAPGLATCNAGIAAAAPPVTQFPRDVRAGPSVITRPQPQSGQPAQPQPQPQPPPEATPVSSASGAITTPELSFIVGAPVAPSGPTSPVTTRVDVPPLTFIVGDALPPPPPGPPVTTTIAVPELTFIVR